MALIRTAIEARAALPRVLSNLGNNANLPDFAAAELKYLVPIIGYDQYSAIDVKINDDPPVALTDAETALLPYLRQFAVIRFASYAEINGDPEGGIDTAIDTAWNIMMQFIAKFRMDYAEDDCGPLGNVEFESMSWNEIDEPVYLENHYGWDLSFPFRSTQPGYDAGKWGESISTTIGGVLFTFKTLTKIIQFEVGAFDAPMNDGDTEYQNNALIGKRVLVVVDGIGLPVDDGTGDVDWTGSVQRRVEKTLAGNRINFVGAVQDEEIVEIFAYT